MKDGRLQTAINKFIEQVMQRHNGQERALKVNDVRLAIRGVRMSEISDWSEHDLDIVEVHAARFDGNAPMDRVLNLSAHGDQEAIAVSSICAPSPFAWM